MERESLDERQGARVGQLVDALAVRQAENEHRHAFEAAEGLLDGLDGETDLSVVGST